MKTSDFDFTFPEELIAYQPLPRGESRMLVVEKTGDAGPVTTLTRCLIDYLSPGDALVLNDTRVLRARLLATLPSGARVEALLLKPLAGPATRWEAMVKPGKRFRAGERIAFSPGLVATVEEVREDGTRVLAFGLDPAGFHRELEAVGRIPLPPYIKRSAESADADAYQSVFAAHPGSVAAPTASLHLSEAMLADIRAKGVHVPMLTLHVGAGTFKPVQSENLEGHVMHSEAYVLPAETATALNAVRARGGRVWAVGTTVARVLETRATGSGAEVFTPGAGETDIFIRPGYAWKGVDGLMTNFHWPKSTLFMLVCSLLGAERAKAIYAQAFAEGFRLFSYGDAMLIR
ncbi:MAG: tRNA preQ1(34) S-adenosylmethionine ribosyltransferase-isomerase QueA [Fibrobacteres bacterium]|nr:tRNA preQ1(34) S-adenosylmethionine ribosyltransferase-isomerase QueA [Fibrobacterota bacterium]